jgi:hypothetical protein
MSISHPLRSTGSERNDGNPEVVRDYDSKVEAGERTTVYRYFYRGEFLFEETVEGDWA